MKCGVESREIDVGELRNFQVAVGISAKLGIYQPFLRFISQYGYFFSHFCDLSAKTAIFSATFAIYQPIRLLFSHFCDLSANTATFSATFAIYQPKRLFFGSTP
ncbi:hypothetical protein [Bacillus sp. THAF10]|uniref:hypothetical protein n=1 Tax=Bacillus sp. THAF10 TaxID=2587848 RepID=UPI001268AA8C|nr:hypothetical protein [Bacillus sp. THAF10]